MEVTDDSFKLQSDITNGTELVPLTVPDVEQGESTEEEKNKDTAETNYVDKYLLYGINESPPLHITIACALQHGLSALSGQLIVAVLVAEVVCAANDNLFKAKILSSTLFMAGFTTVAMNLLGIRLPLFQGATVLYVIPLLMISDLDGTFCSTSTNEPVMSNMSTSNATNDAGVQEESTERILGNLRAIQGSLMVAGALHAVMGGLGLVGYLLKFIGPLTLVPTMILIYVFLTKALLKFIIVSWPISISTIVVSVLLFLYLSRYNMPIPVWTPSAGFRIIHYPLHQIVALLISMLVNWLVCGILTTFEVFPNDRSDSSYNARTDARVDVIYDNPWFTLPYPGQYGPIGISTTPTVVFIIGTFISILHSIAGYYACARVCRVPPPPAHGVNRGILIEGFCSFVSGAVGSGHATTTYGGNIGTIGLSKVASRSVFVYTGVLLIIFGVFGKVSAVFISMPDPVLGGTLVVVVGMMLGLIFSSLEVTTMSSPRNMAILGLSVCIGLAVPYWANSVNKPVSTGNETANRLIAIFLKNPNIVGSLVACFLDNTVPGTKKERGMFTEDERHTEEEETDYYNEGFEVYAPLIPTRMLRWKIMKYLPFLPYVKQ